MNKAEAKERAKKTTIYNFLVPIFKQIYNESNETKLGFLVTRDVFHDKIQALVAMEVDSLQFDTEDGFQFIDGYLFNPNIAGLNKNNQEKLAGYYMYIDIFLYKIKIPGLRDYKAFMGSYESVRNTILGYTQENIHNKDIKDDYVDNIFMFTVDMQTHDKYINELLKDVRDLEHMLFIQQGIEKTLNELLLVDKMIKNIRNYDSLGDLLLSSEYNKINVSFIVKTLYKLREKFKNQKSENITFKIPGKEQGAYNQLELILHVIDGTKYPVHKKTSTEEEKQKLKNKRKEVFKELDFIFKFIHDKKNNETSVKYLEEVLNVDISKIEQLKQEIKNYEESYQEKKEAYVKNKPLSVNNLQNEDLKNLIKSYEKRYNKDIINVFNSYFLGIYDFSDYDVFFNDILVFYLLLKKELVHDVVDFIVDNNSEISELIYDSEADSDNSLNDNVNLELTRKTIIKNERSLLEEEEEEEEGTQLEELNKLLEDPKSKINEIIFHMYNFKKVKNIKFPKNIEVDLDKIIKKTETFLSKDFTITNIRFNDFYQYLKLLQMYRNLTYTSKNGIEFDEIS